MIEKEQIGDYPSGVPCFLALLEVIDRTVDTSGEIAERFAVEVGVYVLMDMKFKADLISAFLQTESLFR